MPKPEIEALRERQRLRDRARGARRTALRRKRRLAGDLRAVDVKRLLEHARTCPLCRCRLVETRERWHPRKKHVDHIVPLAAGGAHTLANVRIICASCNLKRPTDGSDVEQEALWARA